MFSQSQYESVHCLLSKKKYIYIIYVVYDRAVQGMLFSETTCKFGQTKTKCSILLLFVKEQV